MQSGFGQGSHGGALTIRVGSLKTWARFHCRYEDLRFCTSSGVHHSKSLLVCLADPHHWARQDSKLHSLRDQPADGEAALERALRAGSSALFIHLHCGSCRLKEPSGQDWPADMVANACAGNRLLCHRAQGHGPGDQQNRHHWCHPVARASSAALLPVAFLCCHVLYAEN